MDVRTIETIEAHSRAAPRTGSDGPAQTEPLTQPGRGRHHFRPAMPEPRRFPPPWSDDEADSKLDRQAVLTRLRRGTGY